MSDTTTKTQELVEDWISKASKVSDAHKALSMAKHEYAMSQNRLGTWLCPDDAKQCEKFNLWFGSGILQAQYMGGGEYLCEWRKKPSGKQAERYSL